MNIKVLYYAYLAVMLSITLVGCGFEKESSATEEQASEDVNLSNTETRVEDAPSRTAGEASIASAAKPEEPSIDKSASANVAEPKEVLPKRRPLTINVTNLESATAPVVMGIYGTKNKFPDSKDQLKEYRFKPKNGKLSAKIDDLTYGEFAMAIYQDVNSDGKIDKNMIGIPEEPFGFSNNYKPTIKAPSFKDCKFDYNEHTNTVDISLIKR
jgi:uncharacterized protein (DUF2141 family)